ncbi:outer envelope pore protein 16-4, chloroplastic [Argentina anserina]|uniref:outer envelope pore protein 16-4, chloroplastic n=1 Tax=Argentina anserina TaxID=57926 RepID=UPI0021763FEC|nr:outer envelope pore protein 16-4, chloroplastic [Potentilla anserina]XP_050363192.1 outer envelope pore protein 16-4, chloroplastic [Potentilla anserina]
MSLWDSLLGGGATEGHPYDLAPCSSNTVFSILNVGAAGAIWGLCAGPHEAREYGLTGIDRASFVAKNVARYSFQYAIIAGVATASHCKIRNHRGKDDWVNGVISGATTGAAFAALSRSWKQMIPAALVISAIKIHSDYGRSNVKM